MGRKFGFSFSARRASGISSLKGKIAKATGIPTTTSGLYRKIGRAVTGGGLSSGRSSGSGRSKSGRKTFGVSFSINRALGISGAKNSIARAIGIPTTAAGLERKIGKMVVDGLTGGGHAGSTSHHRQIANHEPAPQIMAIPGTILPVPVQSEITCTLCGLPLFMEEVLCPRCAAMAPNIDQQVQPRIVWLNIDQLRPIEVTMLQLHQEGLTDTQLLTRLSEIGMPFEEHPIVSQVRHWSDLTCTHSTHNTDQKREACLNKQAAKIALPSLRHYMALLGSLTSTATIATPLQFAVWLCDDSTENCPICKLREGIVIPVTTRRLPIIDPFCDCNLQVMTAGQEEVFLAQIVRELRQLDAERAVSFQKNAYRSGFLQKPVTAAAAGSCCLLPLVSITAVMLLILLACLLPIR